ncbi:MAG: hypothetical protein U9R74_18865 [Pseudomonadota bacterium]|nr:hypothetical protein [Pseudomonadota bacterium]
MESGSHAARVCFPLAGEPDLQWIRFRHDDSGAVAYREKLSKGLIQFGLQGQAARAFADWCHIIGLSDYARGEPRIEYLLGDTAFRGRSFFLAMTLAHLRATGGGGDHWPTVCATGDVVEQGGRVRILAVEAAGFSEKLRHLVEAVRTGRERVEVFVFPREQSADEDAQIDLDELESQGVEVRPAEWLDELTDLFEAPSKATEACAGSGIDRETAECSVAASRTGSAPETPAGDENPLTAHATPGSRRESPRRARDATAGSVGTPDGAENGISNTVILISTLVLAGLAIKYRWGWDDVEPFLAFFAGAVLVIALMSRLGGNRHAVRPFVEAGASPTPASTLRNLASLESAGFTDEHFRGLHHWGERQDRDGSLAAHKRYLAGVHRYHAGSNNAVLARRIDFLARNRGTSVPINRLVREARDRYSFR